MGRGAIVSKRGLLLSGGQKQWIAIVQAVASDSKMLVHCLQSERIMRNTLDKVVAGEFRISAACVGLTMFFTVYTTIAIAPIVKGEGLGLHLRDVR